MGKAARTFWTMYFLNVLRREKMITEEEYTILLSETVEAPPVLSKPPVPKTKECRRMLIVDEKSQTIKIEQGLIPDINSPDYIEFQINIQTKQITVTPSKKDTPCSVSLCGERQDVMIEADHQGTQWISIPGFEWLIALLHRLTGFSDVESYSIAGEVKNGNRCVFDVNTAHIIS